MFFRTRVATGHLRLLNFLRGRYGNKAGLLA